VPKRRKPKKTWCSKLTLSSAQTKSNSLERISLPVYLLPLGLAQGFPLQQDEQLQVQQTQVYLIQEMQMAGHRVSAFSLNGKDREIMVDSN